MSCTNNKNKLRRCWNRSERSIPLTHWVSETWALCSLNICEYWNMVSGSERETPRSGVKRRVRSLTNPLNNCLSWDTIYIGQQKQGPTLRQGPIKSRRNLKINFYSAYCIMVVNRLWQSWNIYYRSENTGFPNTSHDSLLCIVFVCCLWETPFDNYTVQFREGWVTTF